MASFNKTIMTVPVLTLINLTSAMANEQQEVQDMSDPLAVYTQVGAGLTDKGVNLKFGQTYDTGSDITLGMNIVEVKGVGGEALSIRDPKEPLYSSVDDSIDTIRFRNFKVDTTTGRGSQIDVNFNFDTDMADASYSFIQALPKWGFAQLYPLAGAGLTVENDSIDGFTLPGAFAAIGFYGKFTLTDRIWINYNPLFLTTVAGSDAYKDHHFANQSNILTHEFAISYEITPRTNIRYFANWNELVNYGEGDHRIEINYQL